MPYLNAITRASNQKPRPIRRVADLPNGRAAEAYKNANGQTTIVAKRDRQILDALFNGPIFCASPVRLSDSVLRLRHDHGFEIATEFLEATQSDGAKCRFGFYVLKSPDAQSKGAAS